MENNTDNANFLRQLGQMNSQQILSALALAKTGSKYFQGYITLDVEATAAGALTAYIAALEAYSANQLIDDCLK